MADTHENAIEALRAELNKMSSQLNNVVKSLENRKDEATSDMAEKLNRELEKLRNFASERAQKAYDAGHAGIDEVGEQVRRNPVASLLIAFGAGCVFSCLFRHLR